MLTHNYARYWYNIPYQINRTHLLPLNINRDLFFQAKLQELMSKYCSNNSIILQAKNLSLNTFEKHTSLIAIFHTSLIAIFQ